MKKLEELGISPTPWNALGDCVLDKRELEITDYIYKGEDVKLVAASPDLYEAARQAYELLSNMFEGTQSEGLGTDGCTVRETLRKALEKAGGKE